MSQNQQIVVIGNLAGGKTRLSRSLAERYNIPLLHVDSVQFLPGMKIRAQSETKKIIEDFTQQEKWLVDGFGPLDILEKRFAQADTIIMIDLPLWRHYWWCSKRQVSNLWTRRAELPQECSELSWAHTMKLFKTLKQIHTKMRPELLRILNRPSNLDKTVFIRNLQDWHRLEREGLSSVHQMEKPG